MELDSCFLFLQEQIKDMIIITCGFFLLFLAFLLHLLVALGACEPTMAVLGADMALHLS
jgi:hypothetical protein